MKKGWEYKKLGSICEKSNNINWNNCIEEKSYKYIDLSSVDRESLSVTDPQIINKNNAPSRAKQIVKLGDVIFATTRPTLRRLCIISNNYNNQICSTGFCVLRPNKQILTKWIFYNLLYDGFYKYIEPLQSGANYPAVTDKNVKEFEIPVPPLPEQQRIVSYLDAQFAKIDQLKANAEKQLQAAKDLFQKALKEMLEPKKGWEEKKLGEMCSICGEYGLNESATNYNGIRYIRITDITDDGDLNDEKVSATNGNKKNQEKLEVGDILFARTGATVGKTLVYRKDFGECVFAGYLIRYRTNPDIILPKYLFYFTHSSDYYEWVKINQAAAAQPNISAQKYNGLVIAFPKDTKIQQQIADKLDDLAIKVKQLQSNYDQTIALCNDLKQSLLKKIFE